MIDPLAEVIGLLQPQARFSKVVHGAGAWRVARTNSGLPFYGVVIEGTCHLAANGHEAIVLEPGDFVLIPAARDFATSSLAAQGLQIASVPALLADGEFRVGDQHGPAEVRMLVGHCAFGCPDAALLVSLLPQLVHVRGERRLATLVELVVEESRARRPARDVILAHLLEVLFIEALRSTAGVAAAPGLLRGLTDERLAVALRCMHESTATPWTVAQLAREAALSRSTFFERFSRAVGMAPMAYLLAWRMAVARDLLARGQAGVAEVARSVGYGSASAFSVAFARHTGMPPMRYAGQARARETLAPAAA
ncbi:MAG: AraC family transcriptional regulator [Duganella sp.]